MRSTAFVALALSIPVALALAPRQGAPTGGARPAAGSAAVVGGATGSATSTIPATAAGTYAVDDVHSNAHFRVHHLGAGRFWGRFEVVDGTMKYSPEGAGSLEFDIKIPIAGVHTGNDNLNNHLKSPDFFNMKEFPEMTFKSTKAVPAGGSMWKVDGDLTLLGVTKPVTATIEFTGASSARGKELIGFEAAFTIKRSDFGMTYGVEQGAIGDDVMVVVGLEGIKS